MNPSDPRSRATHAVMVLSRELGRMPCVMEARHFYEGHSLATIRHGGDTVRDVRRRERRLAVAIDYVAQTFDPTMGGHGYHLASLLPIIRQHVKSDHLDPKGLGYDYGISEEDLAIALFVIERASFDRPAKRDQTWTCGNQRIVKMFHSLKAAGATKRGCDRHKAIACKRVLSRAGLAEIIDESYRVGTIGGTSGTAWDEVGYEGRSKRVVVGANHPRRGEWEKVYDELVEWVLTGKRARSEVAEEPKPVGGETGR